MIRKSFCRIVYNFIFFSIAPYATHGQKLILESIFLSCSYSTREWNLVSEQDKKDLGLEAANDGEYWMTYKDFRASFDEVVICHIIGPDMLPAAHAVNAEWDGWKVSTLEGEWVRGKTAGGCDLGS